MNSASTNTSPPWWKIGYVWLVIAGPFVVIVASLFTFYLASQGMDTLVQEQPKTGKTLPTDDQATGNRAPAIQARNHAATGVKPKP